MLWRAVEMCFICYFRVQEVMGGEQRETGRIPRTVECHLTSDLCDSCVPGDTVTVTGIVRVTNDGMNTLKHRLWLKWEQVWSQLLPFTGSWWSILCIYSMNMNCKTVFKCKDSGQVLNKKCFTATLTVFVENPATPTYFCAGTSRGKKDQCMFLIYLEATSVSNTKGTAACVFIQSLTWILQRSDLFLCNRAIKCYFYLTCRSKVQVSSRVRRVTWRSF